MVMGSLAQDGMVCASAGLRAKNKERLPLVRDVPPQSCAACLGSFEGEAQTRFMVGVCPQNHGAHKECIARWWITKLEAGSYEVKCPLCKEAWNKDDFEEALSLTDYEKGLINSLMESEAQSLQEIKNKTTQVIRACRRYNLRDKRSRIAHLVSMREYEELVIAKSYFDLLKQMLRLFIENKWPQE